MIKKLRGTKDYFGTYAILKEQLIAKAMQSAQIFSYLPMETPIIEEEKVFVRSFGVSSDVITKELFTLQDRDGLPLVLRPDGTAGLVRSYIESKAWPYLGKYYYMGAMFRYERPQKGRFRQFAQFGIEYLGNPYFEADIDVLLCCLHFLHTIGIRTPTVMVNCIGTSQERESFKTALKDYLEPFKNSLSLDSVKRLSLNPLRILDSKNEQDQKILLNAPKIADFLKSNSRQSFDFYCATLEQEKISYEINPLLVRGMDYYNGIVFEITNGLDGQQNALVAGGRYDDLFSILGGKEGFGVGAAIGIDRLITIMDSLIAKPRQQIVVLPVADTEIPYAIHIVHQLHQWGLEAKISSRTKLKKRLGDINHDKEIQVLFAIIVGETEYTKEEVIVKNFKTSQQEIININQLQNYFQNKLIF